jgi:hypothetical protein
LEAYAGLHVLLEKFTVRVANPRRDEMMHLTLDASPFSHFEAQEVGQ